MVLNLSHAAQKASSAPWRKFEISDLALISRDKRKISAETSPQPYSIFSNFDWDENSTNPLLFLQMRMGTTSYMQPPYPAPRIP